MTKLIIDIGSAELAGDGESLRSAFAKINNNFNELYGNLQNVIPLVSGQDGKFLSTDGTNLFWEDIPTTNQLVSGESTLVLQSDGNILVNGQPYGPGIYVGITPPDDPHVGKLWFDIESGRMYVYYDTTWVDANPKGQTGTVLPNQNGHTGHFLTTDGSNLSWASLGTGFTNLSVNGEFNVITNNGTIRIRGNTPLGLNPNDSPHLHIESTTPESTDLFFGDDTQFIRLAADGSAILNARTGAMAPVVIKGSDGVMVNNGSAISDINLQNTNVIVTVVDHGLSEGDKVYFQDIEGTVELNNNSYYATNVVDNDFELLDINNDPVLSSDVTSWVSDTGIVYSATRGGDIIINAGGLDDAYGDQGVVELYGKTISVTTQGGNTWLFDSVNLTIPDGGTISYTPTTDSDWDGNPPTTIQEALDRLAAAFKAANGTGA